MIRRTVCIETCLQQIPAYVIVRDFIEKKRPNYLHMRCAVFVTIIYPVWRLFTELFTRGITKLLYQTRHLKPEIFSTRHTFNKTVAMCYYLLAYLAYWRMKLFCHSLLYPLSYRIRKFWIDSDIILNLDFVLLGSKRNVLVLRIVMYKFGNHTPVVWHNLHIVSTKECGHWVRSKSEDDREGTQLQHEFLHVQYY
jgi:hypothetical protein